MSQLDPANPCFGCGGGNAHGMQLVFEIDEPKQRIIGRFRLGTEYQGATGFIHGGIIATVLDEVMSKASRFSAARAVTAELAIEYLWPIRVDEELLVEGFTIRRDGRQLYHEGEIRNAAGIVLARGRGRFVIIDPERYNKKNQQSADSRADAAAENPNADMRARS